MPKLVMEKIGTIKSRKGFSLMELMIVIVIIGILSAGALVIFGGKGEQAKQAATKGMFNEMSTYLGVEMMGCSMGETKTMNDNLTCSGRTAATVVAAMVTSMTNDQMNPYELDKSAVTSGGNNTSDSDAGFIRLSVSGTNIVVKVCHTKPCGTAANKTEKNIPFQ